MAEEWIEKVFLGAESLRQNRLSEAYSWPACGYLYVCVCLQSGLSDDGKDMFFDQLRAVTVRNPGSELLINVETGTAMHGGMGYSRPEPDVEGRRSAEYALAFNLLLGNTSFKKRESHLITNKSGNVATLRDFILFHKTMHKLVTDVKVIHGDSPTTSAFGMRYEDRCATKIQARLPLD